LAAPGVHAPQVNMQTAPISARERAMLPDERLSSLSQSGEGYASDPETSGAMSAAGAGAAAALTPWGRTILRTAKAALPFIAATSGYKYARENLPGGDYLPASGEYILPFLMTGQWGPQRGKSTIGGEPDATLNQRVNIPEYAGEDYGPMTQPQPQARPNLPFLKQQPYPPEAPQIFPKQPSPEALDRMETRSIQEQVRDAANAEDAARQRISTQQWFARNDPSTPKGDLINQFKAQQQANPQPTPETDDLTPILKKSLKAARQRKPPSVQ
jgi:hypothetical protein